MQLLKRICLIVVMILVIVLAGFVVGRLLPGDQVLLQQSGYSVEGVRSGINKKRLFSSYYEQGFHLPVFYFSVSTLAVADSFYYLPDKSFNRVLIQLSMESGQPEKVYELLIKENVVDWNEFAGTNDFTVSDFKLLSSKYKYEWSKLAETSVSWKRYIPLIHFNYDNQFHRWLFGTYNHSGIISGDLGNSNLSGRPVWSEIRKPLFITAALTFVGIVFSTIISVLLAVWISGFSTRFRKKVVSPLFILLYSLPVFWIATWLLLLFCNPSGLYLFPASGLFNRATEGFQFYLWLTLPIFCYSYGSVIFLTRFLIEGFEDEAQKVYSVTALAKGVSAFNLLAKHQLKNILFPALVVVAGTFPVLLSGSVLIEHIFSIPGAGSLMVRAVQSRDIPILTGFFMVIGAVTVIVYQLIDIAGKVLDPRLKISSNLNMPGSE
jgi:peptide/nickel transport system permease protein